MTKTNALKSAGKVAAQGKQPVRFAAGGRGEQMGFTTAPSPFGWLVAGATARGVCWLALAETEAAAEKNLREEFPLASFERQAGLTASVDAALGVVRGKAKTALALDLRGTAFQLQVWQALRAIPAGETRSYSQLALELGIPKATRAVAGACAANRVALLVPCHRVVGANGSLAGYRWGIERKRQLLASEGQGTA